MILEYVVPKTSSGTPTNVDDLIILSREIPVSVSLHTWPHEVRSSDTARDSQNKLRLKQGEINLSSGSV